MCRFAGDSRKTARRRGPSSPTCGHREASSGRNGRSSPARPARYRQFVPTPSASGPPPDRDFAGHSSAAVSQEGGPFRRAAPAVARAPAGSGLPALRASSLVAWAVSLPCTTSSHVVEGVPVIANVGKRSSGRGARDDSSWAKAVTLGLGLVRLLRASGWILCKHSAVLAGPPPSG